MCEGWSQKHISDVADIFDGPHATPKKTHDGPWFLSISSLNGGRLLLEESAHLSEDDFVRWTRRVEPRPGDVLFSYETRLGEAALMPAGIRACLGRRMGLLRPREGGHPRFLLYAFLGPGFQSEIARRTIQGATVDRVPLNELGEWPILIPDYATQVAIAEVLGALDDKIEANRRLTNHCDEAWRTLLATVTDGEVVPLAGLADFVNGGAFTKGASGSGRMVVRIAELNSGPGGSTVYNDIQVKPNQLANPGDLLFAWSGSLGVYRWCRSEGIINQHIFKVMPKPGVPMWLVHGRILDLLPMYRGIAADKATTMGHIQRRHLDESVVVPGPEVLGRLNPVCQGLWDRALAAERENLILADLRDTLLPELLSGRIRVRDIPKSGEELSA
jgi:type I restriction enzyme S subunit